MSDSRLLHNRCQPRGVQGHVQSLARGHEGDITCVTWRTFIHGLHLGRNAATRCRLVAMRLQGRPGQSLARRSADATSVATCICRAAPASIVRRMCRTRQRNSEKRSHLSKIVPCARWLEIVSQCFWCRTVSPTHRSNAGAASGCTATSWRSGLRKTAQLGQQFL